VSDPVSETLSSPEDRNQQNRIKIIIGVICAAFLAALDTTILATVMPTIVGDLGGLSLYSWVFSVYMIMTAVSTPVWGKLSDTLGKRSIFFAAVVLFLFGSILCGLSQSMLHLILFRGIQGIGAGGLASVPFALISTVFPPHERGKALGFFASTWGISSVIGPLLGSFIVLQFDWRWVFFVNIPGAIAAVSIVAANYHERPIHNKEKIDYIGSILLCTAIVSLLLIVLQGGKGGGFLRTDVLVAAVVCSVSTFLFILQEGKAASPILELHFFTRRAFWAGNLLAFMASFAIYGVIAYVPLFAQSIKNGTAAEAGVVITSMSVSWSIASVTAGRIVYRLGEKLLILVGMLFMVVGFIVLLWLGSETSLSFLVITVIIIGLGMGTQTPSLMLSVQHSLDPTNIGVATSTQMLARTIGGAVGVGVIGSAVAGSMQKQFALFQMQGILGGLPEAAQSHLGEPQELLSDTFRSLMAPGDLAIVVNAFATALHDAFVIGLIVTVLGIGVTLLLPPSVLHRLEKSS